MLTQFLRKLLNGGYCQRGGLSLSCLYPPLTQSFLILFIKIIFVLCYIVKFIIMYRVKFSSFYHCDELIFYKDHLISVLFLLIYYLFFHRDERITNVDILKY